MSVEAPNFNPNLNSEQSLDVDLAEVQDMDELFAEIIKAAYPDGVPDFKLEGMYEAFERVIDGEEKLGAIDAEDVTTIDFESEFSKIVGKLFEEPEFKDEADDKEQPNGWFEQDEQQSEPEQSFFEQPKPEKAEKIAENVDSESIFQSVKKNKEKVKFGESSSETIELNETEQEISDDVAEVFSLTVGSDLSATPESPAEEDETFDRLGRNVIDAMKAGSGGNETKTEQALLEMRTNDEQAVTPETYKSLSALNQLAEKLIGSDSEEIEKELSERVTTAVQETAKGEGMGLEGRLMYTSMAAQIAKRLIPGSGLHKKMIETAKFTAAEISEGTAFATAA